MALLQRVVLGLCLCSAVAQAFYLPGVAPQDFKKVGFRC